MHMQVSARATWFLSAILACLTTIGAKADPGAPSPPITPTLTTSKPKSEPLPSDPESVLQKALDLERQRNWTAAIEIYDKALDQWPSRGEFFHRRLLCQTHYRLVRRYQDQSFRNVLLKLPRDRALALYDEVLERIESHYVDSTPLEPLVRRGLDNLEVALRDPSFLKSNVGEVSSDRVLWLREALKRQRLRISVPDREVAHSQVLAACDLARQAIGLGDAAVILEFTYGACDALDDYSSYLTPNNGWRIRQDLVQLSHSQSTCAFVLLARRSVEHSAEGQTLRSASIRRSYTGTSRSPGESPSPVLPTTP